MDAQKKYWAFLSYSHQDAKVCAWLHGALEGFRVPRRLVGVQTRNGIVPRRLFPVFRDRDELPGSASLGQLLTEALAQSRTLIAICSPAAARSRWVNEEIRQFKSMGGDGRVLALIIDGEPNAADQPHSGLLECFPEALKFRVDAAGQLTAQREEPIAADVRKGRENRRTALLRLVAGLLDLPFDELRQRDRERRHRNIVLWSLSASLCLATLAGGLYWQFRHDRMERLEELGREALMQNQPTQAAVYLAESYRLGNDGRNLRIMLDQAMRSVDMLSTIHADLPGGVAHAEFSQDATRLMAVTESGAAPVWRADNGGRLPSPGSAADSNGGKGRAGLRFSRFVSDGREIAAVYDNGRIAVIDARSGETTRQFQVREGFKPRAPAQQPATGDLVLYADADGNTMVFDATRGEGLTMLPRDCRIVAFDGDRALCAGDGSRQAAMHALRAPGRSRPLAVSGKIVAATLFHQTARAALAFADGSLQIVAPDASTRIQVNHPGGIEVVRVSPSNRMVASGGTNGAVLVWASQSGQLLGHVQAHAGAVRDLYFLADDRKLASLGEDGTLKVWDVGSGALLSVNETGHGADVRAALSPDGTRLATWTAAIAPSAVGSIKVWDLAAAGPISVAGSAAKPPDTRQGALRCGARLRREVNADGSVTLLDAATGQLRARLQAGLDTAGAEVDCDADLQWIVTGGNSGAAVLWNATDMQPVARFAGHVRGIIRVVLSAGANRVVSFGHDGSTATWSYDEETRASAVISRRIACRVPLRIDGLTLRPAAVGGTECAP